MEWEINPEWLALNDKPHFVPACCHPDYNQMIQMSTPTDKAAPYKIETVDGWECVVTRDFIPYNEHDGGKGEVLAQCFSTRGASLIVRAVNEHAALLAVAEAAKVASDWLNCCTKGTDQWERGQAISSALARLATLREGKE